MKAPTGPADVSERLALALAPSLVGSFRDPPDRFGWGQANASPGLRVPLAVGGVLAVVAGTASAA
jgi:hypothetical protein